MTLKKLLRFNFIHSYLFLSAVFLVLIFVFRNQPRLQFEIVVASAISYVSVALLHHHVDKSLTFETTIEYILIAVLAIIILQGQLVF